MKSDHEMLEILTAYQFAVAASGRKPQKPTEPDSDAILELSSDMVV